MIKKTNAELQKEVDRNDLINEMITRDETLWQRCKEAFSSKIVEKIVFGFVAMILVAFASALIGFIIVARMGK